MFSENRHDSVSIAIAFGDPGNMSSLSPSKHKTRPHSHERLFANEPSALKLSPGGAEEPGSQGA